jgi:hypothetical protein
MLRQPKTAVHHQAAKLFSYFNNTGGTSKGLNSAFEKADRLLEQKRTGSQFHYIAPLHYKANILCNVSAWL